MDKIITNVSKITNVKKSRIHDVINRNLDKIGDPRNIYKFAAYQCKGIVNENGLCWGISLIQFISPISEDIEIDNILSTLNKYCSRYGYGGTASDYKKFFYNFTEDVKKVDTRLLGYYDEAYIHNLKAAAWYAAQKAQGKVKIKPLEIVPMPNFSEQNVIVTGFNINKYLKGKNFEDYEIHSILIDLSNFFSEDIDASHAICLRVCNKTLFLFDNESAYKISSFNLSDVLNDPKIILKENTALFNSTRFFNKNTARVEVSGVLLKHKQHHLCLEKISKQYNVDEIYVNNLV